MNLERLTRDAEQGDPRAGEALVRHCIHRGEVPWGGGPEIWVHFLTALQEAVLQDDSERGVLLVSMLSQIPDEKVLRWAYGGAKVFSHFRLAVDIMRKLSPDLRVWSWMNSCLRPHRERRLQAIWTHESRVDLRAYQGMTREDAETGIREHVDRAIRTQLQDAAARRLFPSFEVTELEDDGNGGVTGSVQARLNDPAPMFEGEEDVVAQFATNMAHEIDAEIIADLHVAAEQEARVQDAMGRWGSLLEGITDERRRRIVAIMLSHQDSFFRQQGRSDTLLERYAIPLRRGDSYLDAGYVFAPYVPMMTTPAIPLDELALHPSDLRWNRARALTALLDAGGTLRLADFGENADVDDLDVVAGIFKLDEELGTVSIGDHPPFPDIPWCLTCEDDLKCGNCAGSGAVPSGEHETIVCDTCEGVGHEVCEVCNGSGREFNKDGNDIGECFECDGDGQFDCYDCYGSGEVESALYTECPECEGTGACECVRPTPATNATPTTTTATSAVTTPSTTP